MTNMNENKNIWWLVALAAIVVIATAVYVWQGSDEMAKTGGEAQEEVTKDLAKEAVVESEMEIIVTADNTQIVRGGQIEAMVALIPKREMNLDAIDLVIKYDPAIWQYLGLVSPDGAPELTAKKIDSTRGVITLSYYVSTPEGYELSNAANLVGLKMVSKKAGESAIEIFVSETGKERTSRIVEAGTSKLIPFAAMSLAVKVEE